MRTVRRKRRLSVIFAINLPTELIVKKPTESGYAVVKLKKPLHTNLHFFAYSQFRFVIFELQLKA